MDLSLSQIMAMQKELYDLHANEWSPMEPEYGKEYLLYMMEEVGEVISVIKKRGGAVVENPGVRAAFLEEMADVLMYYTDVLLRYHVTPEEFRDAYLKKHHRNLGRDFTEEYKELYQNGEK